MIYILYMIDHGFVFMYVCLIYFLNIINRLVYLQKYHFFNRLSLYENNDAAGTSNEEEKTMSTPAMSAYKDLHSGMHKRSTGVQKSD